MTGGNEVSSKGYVTEVSVINTDLPERVRETNKHRNYRLEVRVEETFWEILID